MGVKYSLKEYIASNQSSIFFKAKNAQKEL